MATFREGNYTTRLAGANLVGQEHKAVKLDANGNVVLATAATDKVVGVLERGAPAGDLVSVALINGNGTFKVIAGGAISIDDELTVDSQGRAVTAVAGNVVFGRAFDASTEAGIVIEYLKRDAVAA